MSNGLPDLRRVVELGWWKGADSGWSDGEAALERQHT